MPAAAGAPGATAACGRSEDSAGHTPLQKRGPHLCKRPPLAHPEAGPPRPPGGLARGRARRRLAGARGAAAPLGRAAAQAPGARACTTPDSGGIADTRPATAPSRPATHPEPTPQNRANPADARPRLPPPVLLATPRPGRFPPRRLDRSPTGSHNTHATHSSHTAPAPLPPPRPGPPVPAQAGSEKQAGGGAAACSRLRRTPTDEHLETNSKKRTASGSCSSSRLRRMPGRDAESRLRIVRENERAGAPTVCSMTNLSPRPRPGGRVVEVQAGRRSSRRPAPRRYARSTKRRQLPAATTTGRRRRASPSGRADDLQAGRDAARRSRSGQDAQQALHLDRQPLLGGAVQDAQVPARVPAAVRLDRARPRVLPRVLRLVQPPAPPRRHRPDVRAAVHYGRGQALNAERQRVLAAAYEATPERFVRGAPKPPTLPTAPWINKPTTEEVAH
jgi:hypothetical protein